MNLIDWLHTEKFFIISGYGAITPGYFLIISKDFIPTYGPINKSDLKEHIKKSSSHVRSLLQKNK